MLKVVLKWMDVYIKILRVRSLMATLKMEGVVKWKGLPGKGPLSRDICIKKYLYMKMITAVRY